MAPRLVEAARRAALSVASLLACALVAEVALRGVGFDPGRERLVRASNGKGAAILCFPSNPRGYFDVDLRNVVTRARFAAEGLGGLDELATSNPYCVEYRYNSQGFRNVEFRPKRPGVRRVVALGDSFTEGWGVREADTYPRVLERMLNARGPGAWEVLNCGRSGLDFPELYDSYEKALSYEPDLLIYGMVLNDVDRSARFRSRHAHIEDWIGERRRVHGGRLPPEMTFFQSRLAAFAREGLDSYRLGREGVRWYLDLYGEANGRGWRRTRHWLREMNEGLEERGEGFLIASWPLLVNLEGSYPFGSVNETVAEFCRTSGIRQCDLLEALRGQRASSLWVHPLDKHPNEIANRLAAEKLAAFLTGEGAGLIPARGDGSSPR